jgi:hypothetical protein
MKLCKTAALIAAGCIAASSAAAQSRDGSHDFDAEFGRWTIKTRRLMHPLVHAEDWVTYEGVKVVTPIWGGKGNVAEVDQTGSAGELHFIALRLYEPSTGQWSLNFTSAGDGAFGTPLYGEQRDGGIEFTGPDVFRGRHILVRFVSREIDADHARSEQYFSDDGGRNWELNWVNEYTRVRN